MTKLDRILFGAMFSTIMQGIWEIISLLARERNEGLTIFRMNSKATEERVALWIDGNAEGDEDIRKTKMELL